LASCGHETQQQAEETKGNSRPEQAAGVQANTQTFADDSIACGLGIINKPQTKKGKRMKCRLFGIASWQIGRSYV